TDRRIALRQTQRKLPARRVSHHHQPVQVQMEPGMLLLNQAVGGPDILERSGPSPTRIAHPPVFEVKGRDPGLSQRFAQVSGVLEVILRPPISPMNVQQYGVWSLGARQTYIKKLIGVSTVRHPLIRRGMRLAQNVFGGHKIAPAQS